MIARVMNRWSRAWQPALRGIAAALVLAQSAAAQSDLPDAGDDGDCTASGEPLECADRCPSFDTCYIDDGRDGRLYYRVMDQRFDCTGLECRAASEQLADYCCQRGQFAPSRGSGGCSCAQAGLAPRSGSWEAILGLGGLALLLGGRRRPGSGRPPSRRG